jgi:hypothetical protein
MSECHNIEIDLSALIDGELPGERQAEVIDHVDHCPQCSQRVAELQKLVTGVAALPSAQPPPQFLADVRRKLRQDQPSWMDTLFRPVWWKVPLEAMAAVLVVAGIFAMLQPPRQKPIVVAKDQPTGVSAKILASESVDRIMDLGRDEKEADRMLERREAAPQPSYPVVSQPQVAAAPVGALPEFPEELVIRGDSVVAVRLRVENLAKQFDGRVESVAPTNAFLVYLPQSKVAEFRSQVTSRRSRASNALAKKAEEKSEAEPVIGVKIVVEP